jgi:Protein of unknown function (DUF1360)
MIPGWWPFVLLALAAYRVWRLAAVDEFPPAERLRNLLIWQIEDGEPRYRHQVGEFLRCSYCSGFWVCLAWWTCWHAWPDGTLVVAAPFSLSTVVGTWAKLLDQ